MSTEAMREFFLWCTVINYAVLLLWGLFFVVAHDWMQRFHGRWFRFSTERFDTLHYAGMAIFKMAILLFNLTPYVALRIAG